MRRDQRVFTEHQRTEALALAEDVGAAEAGRRLEIPEGTIRSWRSRGSDMTVAAAAMSPGYEGWDRTQARLLPKVASAIEASVDAQLAATNAGKARDAKDFAIALGVLIDKALLLAGRATSRTESASVTVHARSTEELMAERDRLRKELGTGG